LDGSRKSRDAKPPASLRAPDICAKSSRECIRGGRADPLPAVRSAVLGTRQSATESTSGASSRGADPHYFPIDPNGNLTSKTEGTDNWVYTWNAENQLTKVEKNGVEQARFGYDPLGRRVEKIAGGVTTTYTYDGVAILREERGSATLKYVQGPSIDEPLAREDGSGTLTYYQADGLGSIVKRTNQAGAVVHEYRYDAWGSVESGAGEPGYAFTGREWDPEIGLYYYRARYYDPVTGTFASADPIESPQLYAYANGDPVRLSDPMGTSAGGTCYDVTITTLSKCSIKVLQADDAGGKGCPFGISRGGGALCDGLMAAAKKKPVRFHQECSSGCCSKTESFSGSNTITHTMEFYIYNDGKEWQAETDAPIPNARRCKVRVTATITGIIEGYRGSCQDKCP
jgi:RHS repeat-associated protein